MRACVSAANASGKPGTVAIVFKSLRMLGRIGRVEFATSATTCVTHWLIVAPDAHLRKPIGGRQTVPAMTGFEQTPVAGSHVPAVWQASCAVQVTGSHPT